MSIEAIFTTYLANLAGFLNPGNRIYWLYLVSAVVLAFVAHVVIERAEREEAEAAGEEWRRRQSFLAYLFDPKVWLHPSSLQDMRFFLANAFVYYALIAQLLVGSHAIAFGLHDGLEAVFGAPAVPVLSGWTAIALYTLASVLVFDFAIWGAHTLFHRVPLLWHFHAVHHSAEQLNPLTLFRMHPVDLFVTGSIATVAHGGGYGLFFYLSGEAPAAATVAGLNAVIFVFYLAGYNLRHSHVWLNYPVWLSRILVSPAQHQIHHSSDPKHFDRNMGLIFSFWDQLFGTHYIPREHEKLSYGVTRREPNPFASLADLYLKPFADAWRGLRRGAGLRVAMIAGLTLGGAGLAIQGHASAERDPVELERMTWTDVRRAVDGGARTVLVPIGGTEQNGPFQSLGKHNTVVAHTAREIARRMRDTLVAPVMAYVPEGAIEPPSGHMEYAGTISVPEPVFEQVLEATARSLRQHGFRTIVFVGDSGSTQTSQARVAAKLSAEWRGTTVASLSDYYSRNGQARFLRAEGYRDDQIGTHAGMRDMSEVLALRPGDVRRDVARIIEGAPSGSNGDPVLASAAIGHRMLELKIAAGLRQLSRIVARTAGSS